MIYNRYIKKMLVISILFMLLSTSLTISVTIKNNTQQDIWELPDPLSVDMILETSMYRRMSVREFTEEPVSEDELSTVLWAAYGLQTSGNQTVSKINQEHAAVLYVFNENGVYTYDPSSHRLQVYLEGDHRNDIHILQYQAPIQLGLCWNTSIADPNQAGVEIGQIGQNIQFMANALGLGTVVTGQIPAAIEPVGIPDDQKGLIIMPLGHPQNPYNFVYRPLWLSFLPKMKESTTTLSTALNQFKQQQHFNEPLTEDEVGQILWSTYGFSPLIDRSDQEPIHLKRHRTVPSAHGYYPLNIYTITENGMHRYYPNFVTDVILPFLHLSDAQVDFIGLPILSHLKKLDNLDMRDDISQICDAPSISEASLLIVVVLDLEKAKELAGKDALRFWYYEAGAVSHNVMLESEAWNVSSKIVYPIDSTNVQSVMGLNENLIPLLLIPVGG